MFCYVCVLDHEVEPLSQVCIPLDLIRADSIASHFEELTKFIEHDNVSNGHLVSAQISTGNQFIIEGRQ